MAVIAVANGVLRESVLVSYLGESSAHLASTALLLVSILAITYLFFSYSSMRFTAVELLAIGGLWVVLTVGFEFLVGYVDGVPATETLAQYDVLAGEVWIFVPVTLFVTPLLFGWYLSGGGRFET